MTKPKIAVLHHLARSGGTLISKCLGSMERVFLLSEIHPRTAEISDPYASMVRSLNPLHQAIRWHDLPLPADLQTIEKAGTIPFEELMVLLARRAEERGGTLLIRDWTHLDFIAHPFLVQPSFELTTADCLRDHAEINQHITVRHPIDQLISLSRLGIMQRELNLREYFKGYRIFAEKAREVGFTRYEDFTQDPDSALQAICRGLSIPFDPGYRERWPDYNHITGDDSLYKTIQPTPRKRLPPEQMEKIEALPDFQKAMEWFGYSD